MTDESGGQAGRERTSRLTGDSSLDLRAVEEGTVLELTGGATAEVVSNPRDGMWILLRYLSVPDEPDLEGSEELIFWADVVGEARR